MTQHKSQDKWVHSTANVFEDLGFEGAEVAVLKIKADLMIELEKAMTPKDWNQTTAAQILGVSRPRLNRMPHGRFKGVTIDKIVQVLEMTGRASPSRSLYERSPHSGVAFPDFQDTQ